MNFQKTKKFALALILFGVLITTLGFAYRIVSAQNVIHPTFPFLDENGENVLDSGKAVSTMETCGQCHDAAFIEEHSYHADVGFNNFTNPGETGSGRAWDTSPGLYGRWNPITYRYLSPKGDENIDLTTAEWVRTLGVRHVGGGPAEIVGVEMNCFLCHLDNPNNDARIRTLQSGLYEWASTATLEGTGIVQSSGTVWLWDPSAFDENGELLPTYLTIQDPDNQNCGQCHGLVHDDLEEPLTSPGCFPGSWTTQTTGQIISPQKLSHSGLNLASKEELTRSWDVHAERLVTCTDCHFSLNNPIFAKDDQTDDLEHLEFDPRRLDISEYLYQPLHQFARGQSTQSLVAPELRDTMRRCESCHSVDATHDWLPYKEAHMEAVNCETCHIPKMYTTAFQQFDWTVLETDDTARTVCRGVEKDPGEITSLVTGFTPVLLPRQNIDGKVKLTPYNLITSWFWVYGNPERPVRFEDLKAAWFEGEDYHPDVFSGFDTNEDGTLSETELFIDTPEKEALIASRLEALGLDNPTIKAEIQPYGINHDIAEGDWVTSDCRTCHGEESLITQPIRLASYIPGGVMPEFVGDANTLTNGDIYQDESGALYYQPRPSEQGFYILGHNSVTWVDRTGMVFFIVVMLAVVGHGGLRVWSAKQGIKADHKTKKIYMYTFYERLWHWLQTFAIVILAITGLIIHKPELFGFINLGSVVLTHNVVAAILAVNAVLALFYNLVSGDIQRFIPQPQGFFNQMLVQIKYYVQGIFKGEEHPFEKTREKRLNPLQKVTYFGILNVLLPLQGLTGILIWGAQQWPELAEKLGGLSFLAPFHSLIAWLFISFIFAHVYLTTTGPTPLAGIKAMMMGWEDVETHPRKKSEKKS
jgi:thiosulfate reductase cytochrome b subunit